MRRALITGGNRGLGFETCRQLARANVQIVLASRDRALGEAAAAKLAIEGASVELAVLDIADPTSVAAAALSVGKAGKIDILVNNAAIAMPGFDEDVARNTIEVNYFGTVHVTDAFLPHLSERGAIVMVSSGLGELSIVGPTLRSRFEDPALGQAGLDELMRSFVFAVERGTRAKEGWPASAYGVSKLGVNAFVRVLARQLKGRTIAINAVCPGWVRTRMGGDGAPRDVADGADGIAWAALLEGAPSGECFRDRTVIDW